MMNVQLLEQLNITLRNIVDTYERLGRGSVSLKRSAEAVAERIAVECNVHVISPMPQSQPGKMEME